MPGVAFDLTQSEFEELERARGRYSIKAFVLRCARVKNKRREKIKEVLPPAVVEKMKEIWEIWKQVYRETHGEEYVVEESVNSKRPSDIVILEKYARMNPPRGEVEKRMRRYCDDTNTFLVSSGHRFKFFQWNAYSDEMQKRKNGITKRVSALRLATISNDLPERRI